ncbi:transposase [Leisingera sp. D0M16]|uniref:transposase n=1 Tax=Leisingera coralii TaxID=3351347 RepID=UPI003B803D42
MCATNSFLKSLVVEIYASRRRRWPDDVKARAVADTLKPGATVKVVAVWYGGLANQLAAWRRLAEHGKLVLPAAELDEPFFAPLVVCDVPAAPDPDIAASEEVIRIVPNSESRDRACARSHAMLMPSQGVRIRCNLGSNHGIGLAA